MIRLTLLCTLFLLYCVPSFAQPIVHYSKASEPFIDKWEGSLEQGDNKTFWIGYRIDKLMERRSFYGSFKQAQFEQNRSLYALIGEPERFDDTLKEAHWGFRFNGQGTFHFKGKNDDGVNEFVLKELAVLVKFDEGRPVEVKASNMSLEVDLEERSLHWLDHAELQESISILKRVFSELERRDSKGDLTAIVGFHGVHPEAERFLTQVLEQNKHVNIREQAAYALGQQNTASALNTLQKVIQTDASVDVKEKAVYALSQMPSDNAFDILIDLARNEPDVDIRKTAIYGIGQRASKKALAALEETIYDEADAAVQKHAVYALTQFDDETAVPLLIDIAQNHPGPQVRKSAIYMLGDIGNAEAVEALIAIVENL